MMDEVWVTSGLSKDPCRHKKTWWWNVEVAEAVREKNTKHGNWKEEKSTDACKEYNTHTQPFYCSTGICPGPPG